MRLNRLIVYVIAAIAAAAPASVISAERHPVETPRTGTTAQPAGSTAGSAALLPATLGRGGGTASRPVSPNGCGVIDFVWGAKPVTL